LANRLSINEIARNISTDVNHQKAKQTRLLRFLKKPAQESGNDVPDGDYHCGFAVSAV
jgi:hypothetical protein